MNKEKQNKGIKKRNQKKIQKTRAKELGMRTRKTRRYKKKERQ